MDYLSLHLQGYLAAQKAIEARGDYVVNNPAGAAASNKKNIIVTQSYIQTEALLNPNLTSYSFGILNNVLSTGEQAVLPLEQRLKLQDVFFSYKVKFYLRCYSTPGGNTSFQYEEMTFPNPNFYGATGIQLDLLTAVWTAGQLQVTVNNQVLTPAWNLSRHIYVPQTQINAINWPGGDNPQNYFNQTDGVEAGFSGIQPNWIMNGGNDNEYVVNYPTSLNNLGVAGGVFALGLRFEGFLAQNCSSIMDAKNK